MTATYLPTEHLVHTITILLAGMTAEQLAGLAMILHAPDIFDALKTAVAQEVENRVVNGRYYSEGEKPL